MTMAGPEQVQTKRLLKEMAKELEDKMNENKTPTTLQENHNIEVKKERKSFQKWDENNENLDH